MIKNIKKLNNTSSKNDAQEIEQAERLNDALEALKRGQSPRHFSADPEFQEALKLHVATTNTEIDDDFKEDVEEIILNRFGKSELKTSHNGKWHLWPQYTILAVTGAVGVLAFLLVTRLDINSPDLFKTTDDKKSVAVANKNSNTNQTVEDEKQPKEKTTESEIPKVKKEPVQKPLSQTSGVELAGVKSEMEEVDKLKEDLEKTISDMEVILKELDEIEQANDFDNLMSDLSSI